jgi:hypothetical protein
MRRPTVRFVSVVLSLALLMSMAIAAPASANVRFADDQIPAYARISAGEVVHDGEWAVIAFYRPPTCVPADFNLLDFFHVPDAFFCQPQTVQTATIWKDGPPNDPAPIHAKSRGLGAVPMWFVSWPELEAAMGDGVLTIGELESLPSLLKGTASFFTETLHPSEAANVGLLMIVARGVLEDGRSFRVHASSNGAVGGLTHVGITFR